MDNVNKQAVIILHEIYGINEFVKRQCRKYQNAGFDVFCPNMLGRPPFSYEESQKAYDYFMKQVGFDVYHEINHLIHQLKETYGKVILIGFSIGATVAWRCCENILCDGIVACYGSRIRDYTNLTPVCPTLLLFATEDSFKVDAVIGQLQKKGELEILRFDAGHGFMDSFSRSFNLEASKSAETSVSRFLSHLHSKWYTKDTG